MPHLAIPPHYAAHIHFTNKPLLAELYDAELGGIPAPISARTLGCLMDFTSAIANYGGNAGNVAPFLADVLRAYDASLMVPAAQGGDDEEDEEDEEEAEEEEEEGDDDTDPDENDDISLISAATSSSSATSTTSTASTTANARGRKRSPRSSGSNAGILAVLENIRDEITELREELGARADAAAAAAATTIEADNTPAYTGYTPPWSVRAVQAHERAQVQANARNACECTRCEGESARRPTYWGFGPGGAGW
ncbi:uncharacterized protein LOC62_05G007469 [Vanrija pseudolonga]|uniref:Uncharacterized protein n=1 Tax=Vanrija pseudolonga TaxID=143232 RepID=A0AAF1BKG5_9TREE|nr:hypothetical protein LOC62_05G007469 [Vanrija pseudolonga]